MWASEATRPMVPWPHMPRYPTLLKKITPAAEEGSDGSRRIAPTRASDPRGSLTTADLNLSFVGMNGCRLLVDVAGGAYVTMPTLASASGTASMPLPLAEELPSAVGWFQWFHTDFGANPLNLASTQRLRVEIVK